MRSLGEIDYQRILEVCGEGAFVDMVAKADLVSIVNWTMIPKMTSILVEIVDRIMPNLPPRDTRNFFFDLTDPAKRSAEDIREVLRVLTRFQAHAEVTLGLNFNEALQVSETLGLDKGEKNEESLKEMATEIRRKLEISCVVVHPVESKPRATKEGAWWSEGPYTETQRSLPEQVITSMLDSLPQGFADSLPLLLLPWPPAPRGILATAKARPPIKPSNFLKDQPNHLHESRNRNLNFLRGIGGCGKSTQIRRLADRLEDIDHREVVTREPGGTVIGEDIRHLLMHADSSKNIFPETELLLFAASRAQLVREIIVPAEEEGKIVLCDRFLDSTTVYQGVARQIADDPITQINSFAVGGVIPDLTVVLDVPAEVGLERIKHRVSDMPDRMEQENVEFYGKVRDGYLHLAKNLPERFFVVDGLGEPDEIEILIWNEIHSRFFSED